MELVREKSGNLRTSISDACHCNVLLANQFLENANFSPILRGGVAVRANLDVFSFDRMGNLEDRRLP